MASLNKIAEEVLLAINKPFDFATHKRIKELIIQARAERIRQSVEKNGIDNIYVQSYNPNLVQVDIADSCNIDVGCLVLRTEFPIAQPIRYKTDVPFLYVGSIDGKISYTYASSTQEILSATKSKFMKHIPRYIYINGYLYIYNVKRVKYISIKAPYENPNIAYTNCSGICYNDDMEFPLPLDMINSIIKEIVSTGILIATKQLPEDEEVKINEEPNK